MLNKIHLRLVFIQFLGAASCSNDMQHIHMENVQTEIRQMREIRADIVFEAVLVSGQ